MSALIRSINELEKSIIDRSIPVTVAPTGAIGVNLYGVYFLFSLNSYQDHCHLKLSRTSDSSLNDKLMDGEEEDDTM